VNLIALKPSALC